MVDVHATTRKPGWRYAVGIALGVAVIGGGAYYYWSGDRAEPAQAKAAAVAAPAVATAKQAVSADEPPVLPSSVTDQARELVGEARRLAASGDFAGAEANLKKAEEIAPGVDETAQTRQAIVELKTPQGQLTAQLNRARSALDLGDNTAAEQAIAEAERLNAPAPKIAELRAGLQAAQQKDTHKSDHIASLLAEMRTAAARQDFATANRALNEAERIDIQNRDVLKARDELHREQDMVRPPVKN